MNVVRCTFDTVISVRLATTSRYVLLPHVDPLQHLVKWTWRAGAQCWRDLLLKCLKLRRHPSVAAVLEVASLHYPAEGPSRQLSDCPLTSEESWALPLTLRVAWTLLGWRRHRLPPRRSPVLNVHAVHDTAPEGTVGHCHMVAVY